MTRGDVLTLTPIKEIVLAKDFSGPNSVLTLLRLFTDPNNIYYKQGVGTHNRFAQSLLDSEDYTKVASAGRLGPNFKQKGGVLVYPGGSSLSREKGFVYRREEFEIMYNLIVTIMGSPDLVNEGVE